MPAILNRIFLAAVCCLLMAPVAETAMRASPKITAFHGCLLGIGYFWE